MGALRVVILGTGFGRTVQAVGFSRHIGFDLVGIAGSQAEKTQKIASELGIPNASADWRALLTSTRSDVVSVATPAALHHPMMLAALETGAHVLCEKPTALHRFQAAEMRERSRAAGKVAAINHEFRFLPARRYALDLVRRGAVGTPRRGEILGRYSIWATPASRGMTWLSDRAMGGGILGALGSHHTDCLRLFLGEPVRTLATVRVDQPRRGPTAADSREGIPTADDACTVQYEFANGATGLVDLNATASYRWERFEITGSEATLRWDDGGFRLWRIAPGKEPEELVPPAEFQLAPREGDPQLVAPFGALLDVFHDAIVNGRPMHPNFDDAVAVQCALDSARLSSESGAWVNVESLAD